MFSSPQQNNISFLEETNVLIHCLEKAHTSILFLALYQKFDVYVQLLLLLQFACCKDAS